MYQAELLTLTDKIRKKNPVIMPNVRTVSVSSARILVTDDHDHITVLDPDELFYFNLYPLKGGINID